jgi:excisionase family DNA binding protein
MTTALIFALQRGQGRDVSVPTSVRSARAPQCEQNLAPRNIIPKQDGHATVASRAPQWSQRAALVEADAPHIGHESVSAGMTAPRSSVRPSATCSSGLQAPITSGDYNALNRPAERWRAWRGAVMGLIDYLKTQFLEIIQWEDDSRDTISFRYPDMNKEIKRGAQLIVRPSQVAQFVYLGQFGDTFGPGQRALTTDNIPILSTLRGWKYGFESPFKADVYFVNTRLFTGNKWGTANPVMMRDPDLGVVRLRAYGTYDFRVVDPKLFLKEVAGTDDHFKIDEFSDAMRSRIVSVFSDALASANVPALDVASRYQELGEALLPLINPTVRTKYGIEFPSFVLENVSVPPEVEQAIDRRSSLSAVGNLNDYVKFQMAQGMTMAEGGGAAGSAAQLGVGLAMGQQMAQALSAAPGAPSSGLPELLSPAEAAKALGVAESDVLTALSEGSLKGKKIGAAWRISRPALEEFLKS